MTSASTGVLGSTAERAVVVVTGVPGSGKTTLATALAHALEVPLVSLDTIKERLYGEQSGFDAFGLRLAAERELVTRLEEALRPREERSNGVVGPPSRGPSRAVGRVAAVVDIWVAPSRDTSRVRDLLATLECRLVEVICRVPGELAVQRYSGRPRTGPHLPPDEATLRRIREATDRFKALGLGRCIEVDTSHPVAVRELLAVLEALVEPTGGPINVDR